MLFRFTSLPFFVFAFVASVLDFASAQDIPVSVGTYEQEVVTFYTSAEGLPGNAVSFLDILPDRTVVAETGSGWAAFKDGWEAAQAPEFGEDSKGNLFERAAERVNPRGIDAPGAYTVHDVAAFEDGQLAIAYARGVRLLDSNGNLLDIALFDNLGRKWGVTDARAVATHGDSFWFGLQAGVAHGNFNRERGYFELVQAYTGEEGVPYTEFSCADIGGDGSVWFGTDKGVVRYKDDEWAYRQGKRWLPNDHVNDIVVDDAGNAWIATNGGVAYLHFKAMTLAEKAAHYESQLPLIKRTPYGYTSEIRVTEAGNLESEIIHSDSDNDGLWTAMYGAGECFAYGATGDKKAKERAKEAFEALRFLQKVTQGGDPSPPKGYVARTILSTDHKNPNIGRLERDLRSQESDTLWKAYEPRWPTSADGEWYWKSDTSSDELDGHYFFYPLYYDLVAETEKEKERVREVVRDLTDHLIEHDFTLTDIDGTPTRWAVFTPEKLNNDPQWWVERGLNSLSMMSYLAVAEHVTGDPKYGDVLQTLVDEHSYAQNAMVPKIQYGIGSGNQSDDEMAFMSFYNLIKYTKNDALREQMTYSFFQYWKLEYPEMNPFFNFAYAAHGIDATYSNQWGTVELTPWEGWLEDSIATLTGFPLDRFNWAHRNSHRHDLEPLARQQARDPDDPEPPRRALLANGKVLPVQERHFNHWNTDPYRLDYGGDGRTLGSGTVFLLPYYMGLYHGFIE